MYREDILTREQAEIICKRLGAPTFMLDMLPYAKLILAAIDAEITKRGNDYVLIRENYVPSKK